MVPKICVNPFLNDFLYDILYGATPEEKKNLPKRYVKRVRTNTAAKQFVNRSYLEEKMEILSSLGVDWFLVMFDRKKARGKYISQLFEKGATDDRKSLAETAVERGMYILTDRHLAFFQGLMADQTNHAIFSQNLLLSKAGYHLHKWKKKIKAGETELAKSHAEVAPYLVETILNTQINLEYLEGFLEVTQNDFKILCYLYIRHHVYVKYEELMERFSGNLSQSKITGCVRRLSQNHMIQRPPDPYAKEYQITAIGIKAVTSFWRQILKANEIQ